MSTTEKIGIGFTSILAMTGIDEIPVSELITALTQFVVAVGTLLAIFKKRK